jgi:hypothetical protein
MRRHILGRRINGELCRFQGVLTDAEFEDVARIGLPQGWVAWHLEEDEAAENSERVRMIRDLPAVSIDGYPVRPTRKGNGYVEYPVPLANGLDSFYGEME